mgnify:CR=1 FL=1
MLKIVQKLKKRIKLLTLDENLVSVVLDMNTEYKKNDFQNISNKKRHKGGRRWKRSVVHIQGYL